MQSIKLIIGLGNPDEKYHDTYHNTGHLFVDYLKTSGSESQALKSPVYMNQSGKFTREEIKKHKIKPKNLLIVHDDADLHLGNYKFYSLRKCKAKAKPKNDHNVSPLRRTVLPKRN